MRRRSPAWSAIGVLQTLSALQVTVAPFAVPLSSARASGVRRVAPVAAFHLAFAMTPAVSPGLMAVPLPTKSMPIARPVPVGGASVSCVTVTVWPATVKVPVRPLVPVCGSTVYFTVPSPLPFGVEVRSIQDTLLMAVQLHAAGAVTVTMAASPRAGAVFVVGDTTNVH